MKTLSQLRVEGKRVLLRIDVNVPMEHGAVKDDFRIRQSISTIRELLRRRAAVICIAHLGRPDGVVKSELSLAPVARLLARRMKKKILFVKTISEAERAGRALSPGDVMMVENIRFWKGEMRNSRAFAKKLASLGDVYVNDAFGDAHRVHASIVGIPKLLPHAAGLLFQREVGVLQRVCVRPRRPFIAILGGAKIESKLPLIERFLKKSDGLLIGGALANTVLAAKHIAIGKSVYDKGIDLSWLDVTNRKFHLPVDAVAASSLDRRAKKTVRAIGHIFPDEYIADIGPDSIRLFSSIIKTAQTIVWNGPLGFAEIPAFARGTRAMVQCVAASGAYTVLGGGDLARVVDEMHLQKKIGHISTGGGAMLEFLSGKKLPAIEALK